jgi:GTP-binding protein HflX
MQFRPLLHSGHCRRFSWKKRTKLSIQIKEGSDLRLRVITRGLSTIMQKTYEIAEKESVVLVSVCLEETDETIASLEELARLVDTAGASVVGELIQNRAKPDPRFYIGRGKVEELKALVSSVNATTVVFDDELSPSQQRNVESELETIKVIDRTTVILDIFAQRAQSREGKLQVRLAQLRYLMPRLTGKGHVLSRLGGGIGTRGPGETKLEADRRRMRRQIHEIELEIDEICRQRSLHREQRKISDLPSVSLIGYTNAGKSTLLNLLTGAGVLVEDKLFATLDPTIRLLTLPTGRRLLLSDTVGFIKKLPHSLIAAFRATLEEVVHSDILIHVIDISSPNWEQQKQSVLEVLKEIGCDEKTVLTVFNKSDLVSNSHLLQRVLREPDTVAISARYESGVDNFLVLLDIVLNRLQRELVLGIPYSEAGLLSLLHEQGVIHEKSYEPDFIRVRVTLPESLDRKFSAYRMEDPF